MDASRRWYRLHWVKPPWGDYGEILLSGMTAHRPRTREGLLRLERTGPFVPPITLAGLGDLLITNAFRTALEESPLAGLAYRPVEKTRIVRLRWEHWDWTADDPREYPDGGEPEAYILDRPHDRELAMEIGPIWEVLLPSLAPDGGILADLVRDQAHARDIYASQPAREWLEQHAGDWLSFAELSEV
jgi:hypothetical protein